MGLTKTSIAEQVERRRKEKDHIEFEDWIIQIQAAKVNLAAINANIATVTAAIASVGDTTKEGAIQDAKIIKDSLADYEDQKTSAEKLITSIESSIGLLWSNIVAIDSPYDDEEKDEFTAAKNSQTLPHLP